MLKNLVKVKDKVEFLLKQYPVLRDDDKKLWLAYLNKYHNLRENLKSSDPYESFKSIMLDPKTPTMESIRRTRQKFQESGKYLGEKRAKKLEEASNMKDWALENKY